jgi:hypothetical protein
MNKIAAYWKAPCLLILFLWWIHLYRQELDKPAFTYLGCLFIYIIGCIARQDVKLHKRDKPNSEVKGSPLEK